MKSIYAFAFAAVVISNSLAAQIPVLNSNPAITNRVIYLDFDGQVVSGTGWNGGNTINAAPSVALGNANNMRQIWNRVSEDYRPFNVNVTTDSVRFNNANPTSRIRVVFTPTSAWYGSAGGVAFLGSFTWGGYPGTPCWIFENQLGYNIKSMAEAASHEAGHTLSLVHQSTYNSSCVKTAEYNGGQGTGVTSWAPIMGVGYNRNVTVWHNGRSASGCNIFQLDHGNGAPGLTGGPYLSFLPDDVGDNFSSGKILNLNTVLMSDSGLITTPADQDVYRFEICNNRYVSVNVRPWALDSTQGSYQGANLDVKLKLFNAAGTMLIGDSATNRLNALVGLTLSPGQYYFSVDGGSSNNYGDYGSLGKYYLLVKATNPPQLANTIVLPASICAGQSVTLNSSSNGTPTTWQWDVQGPLSGSFAVANPPFVFGTAGVYTISLLATSATSLSCVSTRTIFAGVQPTLTLSSPSSTVCGGAAVTLQAAGASSYTWLPGNFAGSSLLITPTVSITYTLLGSNGNCINSAAAALTVAPQVSVSVSVSNTTICAGASATISASGAVSYVFNPGNITTNPAVVSPASNTTYTITGTSNGCSKAVSRAITVRPTNYVNALASNTLVCPGEPVTLSFSGGTNYTLQPGNQTGNPIVVGPLVPTIYTVTSTDNFQCAASATVDIQLAECDQTGLAETLEQTTLMVYPNPANTYFTVSTGQSIREIAVYNSLGQIVFAASGVAETNLSIHTQGWSRGMYVVTVRTENNLLVRQKVSLQ